MAVYQFWTDLVSIMPEEYYQLFLNHQHLLLDYQYFLLALLFATCGPILYFRRKKRFIPGIPVIGIEDSGGIEQARETFCTDAKTILNNGYLQACRT